MFSNASAFQTVAPRFSFRMVSELAHFLLLEATTSSIIIAIEMPSLFAA